MSSFEYFSNQATRHSIRVGRLSRQEAKKSLSTIRRLQDEVSRFLSRANFETDATVRVQRIAEQLNASAAEILAEFGEGLESDLEDFAKFEGEFNVKLGNQGTKARWVLPSDEQIQAGVFSQYMDLGPQNKGRKVGDVLNDFNKTTVDMIDRVIRDGYISGTPTQSVIRDVNDRLGNVTSSQMSSLINTVYNFVSNQARQETLKANEDVLVGYQWVAILDSRTTLICSGRDGMVYPIGQGPLPPAHYNCRSTVVPKVKPEFDLGSAVEGERPALGGSGEVEQIGANKTYGGWLRGQDAAFKREYFEKFPDGEQRYRLFQQGRLTLDKFTDSDGGLLSLDNLKTIYAQEWQRAGLE